MELALKQRAGSDIFFLEDSWKQKFGAFSSSPLLFDKPAEHYLWGYFASIAATQYDNPPSSEKLLTVARCAVKTVTVFKWCYEKWATEEDRKEITNYLLPAPASFHEDMEIEYLWRSELRFVFIFVTFNALTKILCAGSDLISLFGMPEEDEEEEILSSFLSFIPFFKKEFWEEEKKEEEEVSLSPHLVSFLQSTLSKKPWEIEQVCLFLKFLFRL